MRGNWGKRDGYTEGVEAWVRSIRSHRQQNSCSATQPDSTRASHGRSAIVSRMSVRYSMSLRQPAQSKAMSLSNVPLPQAPMAVLTRSDVLSPPMPAIRDPEHTPYGPVCFVGADRMENEHFIVRASSQPIPQKHLACHHLPLSLVRKASYLVSCDNSSIGEDELTSFFPLETHSLPKHWLRQST